MLGLSRKQIIFLVKILIGILSFWIIYNRLVSIPQLKEQCVFLFNNTHMHLIMLCTFILMPVNWGIESYKWKIITKPVERVSYSTAIKSVLSGICVGNIAPGRAMEFLAKIVFFKPEHRPNITVLHFINGMFQMMITVMMGLMAVIYKFNKIQQSSNFAYAIIIGGMFIILCFCWAIFNVSFIQKKLKFIKWFRQIDQAQHIQLSKTLMAKLVLLSIIRYSIFTTQFYLIYNALSPQGEILPVFASVAAYFMLTSIIPMISIIEPAIRAAIAIFVFNGLNDNSITVVIASTFIWIVNVVVPSILGYIIILKEKIDFKSARAH